MRKEYFFLQPVNTKHLGMARFILLSALGIYYFVYRGFDPRLWGELDASLFKAEGIFRLFYDQVPSKGFLEFLFWFWVSTFFLAWAGLFGRVVMPLFFVASFFTFGLPRNFHMSVYNHNMLVISLAVLSFAPCTEAFSLDAIRKKYKPRVTAAGGWACATILCLYLWAYFIAGINKFRNVGMPDFLEIVMPVRIRMYENPLGEWLTDHMMLVYFIGSAAILLELIDPLALLSKRWCMAIVGSLLTMQTIIWIFVGPQFFPLMACPIMALPLLLSREKKAPPERGMRARWIASGILAAGLLVVAWTKTDAAWPLQHFPMFSGYSHDGTYLYIDLIDDKGARVRRPGRYLYPYPESGNHMTIFLTRLIKAGKFENGGAEKICRPALNVAKRAAARDGIRIEKAILWQGTWRDQRNNSFYITKPDFRKDLWECN